MQKPKILFVSPWGLYPKAPIDKDPIDYFYYRNTLKQKIFQLRIAQSWHPLHYLAQNLPVHSVVFENPSQKKFKHELKFGYYTTIAISFTAILVKRTYEMVVWLKLEFPHIDIILGGYGTSLFKEDIEIANNLKKLATHVCVGEGLSFMQAYLKQYWQIENKMPHCQDLIPASNSLFRFKFPLFKQFIILSALGCPNGCPFCATSSQFDKNKIDIATGKELFAVLLKLIRQYPSIQSVIIYNEDFLANRATALEFMDAIQSSDELKRRPIFLTIFASVSTVKRYNMKELLAMHIGTVFIGVESLNNSVINNEKMQKRDGDIKSLFKKLHKHGINTLGSMIIGWDDQNPKTIKDEIQQFVALHPTFYQVIPLHPIPGTPIWKKMLKENRILESYSIEHDSISNYNFLLKNFTESTALNIINSTYNLLVKNNGPWPYRYVENMINGYLYLSDSKDSLFIQRTKEYKNMLLTLLPLAIVSRFMFHGKPFTQKWYVTMHKCFKAFPIRFIANSLLALLLFPILEAMYLFGNMRFMLSPHGEQPECIRREYKNQLK